MSFLDFREKIRKSFSVFSNKKKYIPFIEKILEFLENEDEIQKTIKKNDLPNHLKLRDSNFFVKFYHKIFPISHLFRMRYKYNREFLDKFVPLSNEQYIGRGNYKFVFQSLWKQVIKIGISKLPSDILFGNYYEQVAKNKEIYLKNEEIYLCNFLKNKTKLKSKKDNIEFNFIRLGLERLFYFKIKSLIPDLILSTQFFMGLTFRNTPFGVPMISLAPCDNQEILMGKHLKEFIYLGEKVKKKSFRNKFFPEWKINFNAHRFGKISKSKLKKIALDFYRIIEVTKYLEKEEKIIFDIHTENIIITVPQFKLKIFDYHLFDQHVYPIDKENLFPDRDHTQVIEEFISSFEL